MGEGFRALRGGGRALQAALPAPGPRPAASQLALSARAAVARPPAPGPAARRPGPDAPLLPPAPPRAQHLLARNLIAKNATVVPNPPTRGNTLTRHTFLLHLRRFAPAVRLGPGGVLQEVTTPAGHAMVATVGAGDGEEDFTMLMTKVGGGGAGGEGGAAAPPRRGPVLLAARTARRRRLRRPAAPRPWPGAHALLPLAPRTPRRRATSSARLTGRW
jgi:hypothetical protein